MSAFTVFRFADNSAHFGYELLIGDYY